MKDSVIIAVFVNLAVVMLATSGQPDFAENRLTEVKYEQSNPKLFPTENLIHPNSYFTAHKLSLCAANPEGADQYQVTVSQCVGLDISTIPLMRDEVLAQSR